MKKFLLILTVLTMLVSAAAMAEETTFASLTKLDALQKRLDSGVKIEKVYYTDGFGFSTSEFTTTNALEISRLWTALNAIELGEKTNEAITDWYPQIVFYLSDGSRFNVCFDKHWLEIGGRDNYTIHNDEAFWSLTSQLVSKYSVEEPLLGGWTPAADPAITEERLAIFQEGMENLVGVNYVPIAYLGSQIVAGTNHCILCQATVVYPGASPAYVLVYLYEDLQGGVSVLSITDLDIGALCKY